MFILFHFITSFTFFKKKIYSSIALRCNEKVGKTAHKKTNKQKILIVLKIASTVTNRGRKKGWTGRKEKD